MAMSRVRDWLAATGSQNNQPALESALPADVVECAPASLSSFSGGESDEQPRPESDPDDATCNNSDLDVYTSALPEGVCGEDAASVSEFGGETSEEELTDSEEEFSDDERGSDGEQPSDHGSEAESVPLDLQSMRGYFVCPIMFGSAVQYIVSPLNGSGGNNGSGTVIEDESGEGGKRIEGEEIENGREELHDAR